MYRPKIIICMVLNKFEKSTKMVKNKKEFTSPRRRRSITINRVIGRVTKALSRPVSGTASHVAPVCNIKVVVRVRPMNKREKDENFQNVIKVIDDQTLIFDPKENDQPFFFHGVQQKSRDLLKRPKKDITFMFDKVFHNNSTNLEVFEDSTKNLINNLMDGYNCSVFTYGATGAGKTYTMIGKPRSPGITYLTMKDLFERKEELSGEREFELMLTYIEVYNELVKDLLNPGPPLNLREDAKYGVMIPGVKGYKINSPDELFSLLEQGNKRRTQHPTDANAESSRSHAVFQVYIQMTNRTSKEVRRAKLSMIDLAGSERGSVTGHAGARFKEGANINKSLLALGNCINSLADGHQHIPYRDSKLTRLLKDSLGGNCHTIMIANVSPSSMSFDDTYNTLKYATRAKKIKCNMKSNVVNVDMNVDQYIKLVDDLQTENTNLKAEVSKLKEEVEQLHLDLAVATSNNKSTNVDQPANDCLDFPSDETTVITPTIMLNSIELPATKENVAPEVLEEFNGLVSEMKELMEREFQLRSCELGMSFKRKLKTETKNRLSNFYVDTPDKEDMRRKLAEQVNRSEKKERSTNSKTEEIVKQLAIIDEKLSEMLDKHPGLKDHHTLTRLDLDNLACKYKSDLKQKEIVVLMDDHKDKCAIIENMAQLLKPLFLAVGGKDGAPDSIKREYENLVAFFNGKKNLKWQESDMLVSTDSGVSSLTSVHETDENSRSTKRKIETDSQLSLESTFTCENAAESPVNQGGARTPVGGKSTVHMQMMAKGYKSPVSKRLANGSPRRFSPRSKFQLTPRGKIVHPRKPAVRPDTARALLNVKKAASKPVSERPRFRF